MPNVVGTVIKVEPQLPPPGTFRRGDDAPSLYVEGDNGDWYRFAFQQWAKVGQKVLIADGETPILVGPCEGER